MHLPHHHCFCPHPILSLWAFLPSSFASLVSGLYVPWWPISLMLLPYFGNFQATLLSGILEQFLARRSQSNRGAEKNCLYLSWFHARLFRHIVLPILKTWRHPLTGFLWLQIPQTPVDAFLCLCPSWCLQGYLQCIIIIFDTLILAYLGQSLLFPEWAGS